MTNFTYSLSSRSNHSNASKAARMFLAPLEAARRGKKVFHFFALRRSSCINFNEFSFRNRLSLGHRVASAKAGARARRVAGDGANLCQRNEFDSDGE